MVDAHCHLNFKAFEKDLDSVIKEAFEAGVKAIIVVGSSIESSKKAIEIAQKHDNIFASVGVHPHHADKLEKDWFDDLEKLAKHEKIIAVGETGLDYYSYKSNGIIDPEIQKEIFIQQIELSYKLKLPLQIHNRHAGKDILEILLNHKSYLLNPPGMFHCFSGDIDFLKKVLDLGFYIGFDGNITYKGTAKGETTSLIDLVKTTPTDRILVETDSPYLAPVPFRNLRNTPKNAIIIGETIAKLKNISYLSLAETVYSNFLSLFKVKI